MLEKASSEFQPGAHTTFIRPCSWNSGISHQWL